MELQVEELTPLQEEMAMEQWQMLCVMLDRVFDIFDVPTKTGHPASDDVEVQDIAA